MIPQQIGSTIGRTNLNSKRIQQTWHNIPIVFFPKIYNVNNETKCINVAWNWPALKMTPLETSCEVFILSSHHCDFINTFPSANDIPIPNLNTLWPSDTIWHKSGSTLAQVMACCLTAPSHYLNQCWLIISKVQWHPSESNFTRDTAAISHWN